MPSPFPGVDPYIEAQGLWEGFHASLLAYFQGSLNQELPPEYLAGLRVRLEQVALTDYAPIPVDFVGRRGRDAARSRQAVGSTATIEPIENALPRGSLEVRRVWIEIRKVPDPNPVTVIELLSPANKRGEGIGRYLRKRKATIRRKIHLVEIDLLLTGERLPMAHPLPSADYFALLSRAEDRPRSCAYAWTVRDPLPTIPIPLKSPDPDVGLDLSAHFATAYDRGRFASVLDYSRPLATLKKAADRTWAERTARAARR